MKLQVSFLSAAAFAVSGCASTFETIAGRAITSDHLDKAHDRNKMRSQTGDRRNIYFLQRPDGRLVICPEPFAGAMTARGAASGLTITGSGEASDAVTASLLAVDGRSPVNRLYQDAAFQYCMRYQEGTITAPEFHAALDSITKLAFQKLPATSPPPTEKKAEAKVEQVK